MLVIGEKIFFKIKPKYFEKIFNVDKQSIFIKAFLLSLIFQMLAIGKYIDNSILSAYSPDYTDSIEYVQIASIWGELGFNQAFSDLWRMPGYPALILVLQNIIPQAPYLAIRIVQLILIAVTSGIFGRILINFFSKKITILFIILYITLPIWFFTLPLIPESFVIFFMILIVYTLLKSLSLHNPKDSIFLGILIALATYFKPNSIILIFPVLLAIISKTKDKIFIKVLVVVTTAILGLTPWLYFTKSVDPNFSGLTSTQGINLYIGTGMSLSYDGSALMNSAVRCSVDPISNPQDNFNTLGLSSNRIEQSSQLTNKSVQIWKERPANQLCFSFYKILRAYGLIADSWTKYVMGVFHFISFLSAILILNSARFRYFGVFAIGIFSILAVQAAVFQSDHRFIFVITPPVSLIVIAMAIRHRIQNRKFPIKVENH